MATSSSRQTSLFGLQDWKKFYSTYAAADFQSFDYETLRKNFIDYLTQNYPEVYNDYVESSEFVALLDVIAFMGQALAFRSDLNARENFMDTAERRDSVIKLANLVSYNPKRNTTAQGLVKVTAISTTEDLTDINGTNISNTTILWNDPANPSWQEQFNTILNATLINSQRIGRPGNTQSILGIKTDEYSMNTPAGQLPVMPYQAEIDGTTMNFELTSSTSLNQDYVYELPPAPTSQFNILYRNDKLGYGSPNTGFFFLFKQGTLQSQNFNFAEKVENNLQPINIQGINETDTWLYKLTDQGIVSTLWTQVESVYVGTTNSQGQSIKPVYSVASRANDEVTYVFSDGVFGEIPYGLFRAYVRSSNALQYTIDPSEMSGIVASMQYISRLGTTETLTFTFSLQTPCSTAQNRESLATIKERAPARYYTQNRMVNGEDYTNFPFTLYNSIIKSKALNRTSIGITRGLELLDPTGKYSSTNVFGTDGAVFFDNTPTTTTFSTVSSTYASEFLTTALPTLLASTSSVQYYQQYYTRYDGRYTGLESNNGRCYWNQTTVSGSQVTGYFYVTVPTPNPIAVGQYSTETMRYISKGAQLNFVSGPGMYFDANNRLTSTNTGVTSIWVGVTSVTGDGYNFGTGNLTTGVGPVVLSSFVPTGAFLNATASIIPEFDNSLSNTLVTATVNLISLNQDFALKYDSSILSTEERWSIIQPIPTNPTPTSYFISFVHNSTDKNYTVTIQNVTYTFASVNQVRFIFDGTNRIYDPTSGQILSDSVNVLKSNSLANNAGSLPINFNLNVTGQPVESDGFVNDFEVLVSSINSNTGFSFDPNFFVELVGGTTVTNTNNALFFVVQKDSNGLTTTQVLPDNTVVYGTTLAAASESVYQYIAGTVFYCPTALNLSATRNGYSATATTLNGTVPTPHFMSVGDMVTISGFTSTTYNGTYVVTEVPTSSTFKYTLSENTDPSPAVGTGNLSNRFYQSSVVPGTSPEVLTFTDVSGSYAVKCGRGTLSFQYRHNSSETNRVDPATTNIIDLYLVTQAYYTNYMNWLTDTSGNVAKPAKPTINELQQAYGALDSYKMISDSVVLNSVVFKPLFGTKAPTNLQGTIKVIKSPSTTASDSQIRSSVLSALNSYFTIDNWTFGDTFYFSELTAYLHVQLGSLISSVILVPADPAQKFGDLYEIRCAPNEIFVNGATASDITVISALTASNMNR